MKQEQIPRVNVPESEPSSGDHITSPSIKTEVKLKPPLVSEEDLKLMKEQIDDAFEHSTLLSEKKSGWKRETGMGEQESTAAKIAFALIKWPVLAGRGLLGLFKNKHSREE